MKFFLPILMHFYDYGILGQKVCLHIAIFGFSKDFGFDTNFMKLLNYAFFTCLIKVMLFFVVFLADISKLTS